jgi:NADH-quinone oxidoreductase subunit L
MLGPLVILATLSIVGGWVGVPGSLGGSNHFDKFLGPVFRSSTPVLNAEHAQTGETAPAEKETEGEEPKTGHGTELMFTGISVAAGLLGLFLAWLFYIRSPEMPGLMAAKFHGLYHALADKYWVDELYSWIFVKPLIAISGIVFWRGIDQGVIDATLDGSADAARDVSDNVRHMQSGNLRSYAGWVAVGAMVVIIYMVWVGLRTP